MNYSQRIARVLIVGAGWTGRQIAARMGQYGIDVWIRDRNTEVCKGALEWIRALSPHDERGEVSHGQLQASPTTQKLSEGEHFVERIRIWEEAKPADVQLVLECVPEQASIKKRTLRQVSREFPSPTIIASNSSYFVPSVLGQFVEQTHRFAHLHFHVPVLRTSVVDISSHSDTDSQVVELLSELVRKIGHAPIILAREHPGYIFNWLLQSVLSSALVLAEKGVASPETIDQSWKAVTGMPLGPFGIMDQIGLDVIEQVLHNSKWAPTETVKTEQLLAMIGPMVADGKLGTKTGSGFYDYDPLQTTHDRSARLHRHQPDNTYEIR